MQNSGPSYGYYANPAKTLLIMKEDHLQSAKMTFASTGVNITTHGKRHLGAALGSTSFVESYVQCKVSQQVDTVKTLSRIPLTQPRAAYSAFTHGLSSKWNYLMRTIPGISDLLLPLDEVIDTHFIPALTGHGRVSDLERQLLALPTQLGSLSIAIPSKIAPFEHSSTIKVTAPLVALIVQQNPTYTATIAAEQQQAKSEIRMQHRQQQTYAADQLQQILPRHLKRAMELGSEKGASSWLSALPVEEPGLTLHKGDFRDALCLRYGWQPTNVPSKCTCGASFSVEHTLCCSMGGFPTIRHIEIRDFIANVMSDTCHDVCIEPPLQALTTEPLPHATSNRDDGARLDIRAQGFWDDRHKHAFFDVRVFYPNAPSYRNLQLGSVYSRHEKEKKRSYEDPIREVEHGSFTPLVFSTSGGMGTLATTAYKRLASQITWKKNQPYNKVMAWLCCHLCFSLLRSSITVIREARSRDGHAARAIPAVDLAVHKGQVQV